VSLISAAELAALLDDPDQRIADVRWSLAAPAAGRAAYAEAHLPGAVFVDLDTVLTAPVGPGRHPLPDPAAFAEAMGALGIGRAQRVVAYDDAGGTVAARLWWMLEVLGHPRAAVLDAGSRWRTAGCRSGGRAVASAVAWSAASPWPPLPDAWPRTIGRAALTPRLGALTLSTRGRRNATAARSSRSAGRRAHPDGGERPPASFLVGRRFLAPDALAARFAASSGRGAAGCRRLQGRCQPASLPRDAGCRAARSPPLPRLVLRLEPRGDADRDRRRAGRAAVRALTGLTLPARTLRTSWRTRAPGRTRRGHRRAAEHPG
jgi:thiosulfate/3-mercaptopyruvate sulfurtransferase